MEQSGPGSVKMLFQMLEHYTGCTKGELSKRLGVDRKTLRAGCSDPRLSVLRALSRELDWPIETVAESIDQSPSRRTEHQCVTFEAAHSHATEAYARGAHRDSISYAREMWSLAKSNNGRAAACNLESGSWNALGLHLRELDVIGRALKLDSLGDSIRERLLVNRANALYELAHYHDAAAIAERVIAWARELDNDLATDVKCTLAFAHYVLGVAELGLMPTKGASCARRAKSNLEEAVMLHRQLFQSKPDWVWIEAITLTCQGALLEAETALGQRTAQAALSELEEGLEFVDSDSNGPGNHMLESLGRRCISAANICSLHLAAEDRARPMALFLGKARDIAESTDNWSLWERVLTLDLCRREAVAAWLHTDLPWPMDHAELRVLVGTMGRFPAFRETGWKIFGAARLLAAK